MCYFNIQSLYPLVLEKDFTLVQEGKMIEIHHPNGVVAKFEKMVSFHKEGNLILEMPFTSIQGGVGDEKNINLRKLEAAFNYAEKKATGDNKGYLPILFGFMDFPITENRVVVKEVFFDFLEEEEKMIISLDGEKILTIKKSEEIFYKISRIKNFLKGKVWQRKSKKPKMAFGWCF